jgi:hypothetical protein
LSTASTRALLELEFDLKLALVAIRDYNIHCKKRTATSIKFAVTVATAVRAKLSDLVAKYKEFKPSISQEALKSLD